MMEIDLDFIFFSAGIFFSLPIFWLLLAQKRQEPERSEVQIPTMVVLGSGGHTTEILRLSSSLKEEVYQPRSYVIADSDVTSEGRLRMASLDEDPKILRLPRAREVSQAWFSSLLTTCNACLAALQLMSRNRPSLLLCNGPGTCIPLCLSAWFFNKLFLFSKFKTKIVYVESICRVKTLSLSAKILVHFADQVLVQWPELAQKYPKTKYINRFT